MKVGKTSYIKCSVPENITRCNGVEIINYSSGGNNYLEALADSIQRSTFQRDNCGDDCWQFIAQFTHLTELSGCLLHDNIINVAPTTPSDIFASFSNFSNRLVSIAALGVSIRST
jgi:hypothetical protein